MRMRWECGERGQTEESLTHMAEYKEGVSREGDFALRARGQRFDFNQGSNVIIFVKLMPLATEQRTDWSETSKSLGTRR